MGFYGFPWALVCPKYVRALSLFDIVMDVNPVIFTSSVTRVFDILKIKNGKNEYNELSTA
jgi:hypothetical protein